MTCLACGHQEHENATCNQANCACPKNYKPKELVDHPQHYGGGDNPYEAIKVIDAWDLGFSLGNCVKYICRAGQKPVHETQIGAIRIETVDDGLTDLKKARWYLDHEIQRREKS